MVMYEILFSFVVFYQTETTRRNNLLSVKLSSAFLQKEEKAKNLLNKSAFQVSSSIIGLRLSTHFLEKSPFYLTIILQLANLW